MNVDQKMNIYYFLRNMYHFLRNYPVYLSYFIWGSANSGAEKAIWQIYELHATHTQITGKMAEWCDNSDQISNCHRSKWTDELTVFFVWISLKRFMSSNISDYVSFQTKSAWPKTDKTLFFFTYLSLRTFNTLPI